MPSDALDRLARDPDLQAAVGAALIQEFSGQVIFQGGGSTWRGTERLYSMRIQVLDPANPVASTQAAVLQPAVAGWVIWVSVTVITSIIGAVLIAYFAKEAVVEAREGFELMTPEQRDELLRSINWTVRAATFAAVAVVVGVSASMLRNAGVLS